ncbi:hypothetical protein [Advenella kashmirensis]|uniref:hypothetical protein n=1 Tax=Advenella kashmirensis TaxID=310575 RepID=UPI001EE680FB|nr:hypothetical protein [Advenella kashmirensis]
MALLIGTGRTCEIKLIRALSTIWVYVFRSIPLIMIIFWHIFCFPPSWRRRSRRSGLPCRPLSSMNRRSWPKSSAADCRRCLPAR